MDDRLAPVVAGYRLGTLLGRGASAEVWGGRRILDGRPVAIKVVPMPPGREDLAVRELGLLRGLAADHVVALLDAVPVSDPVVALALVMERYDGGSLAQVVAARGRLTAGEIVTALSPVAAALGALHQAGVVHGDLTPGNVLFDDTGRPAIGDLGVTRVIGERTAEVFGTQGFLAPEVCVGGQPTTASDVYAVGALAWFCAAGQAPDPVWLRSDSAEALADLPPALVGLVDACLSAEPSARPSAVDVSVAMFQCAPAEPMRLPGSVEAVESLTRRIRANASFAAPAEEAGTRPSPRWWQRRRRRSAARSTVPATAVPAAPPTTAVSRPAPVARAAAPLARAAAPPRQAARTSAPPGVGGRHRGSSHRWAPMIPRVATAVLAGVLLTVGGLVAVAAGWEPSDVLPHQDARSARSQQPATTSYPLDGASPSPRAPLPVDTLEITDPRAVAQTLADARAAVWTSGELARLGAVDAPGSPAWAEDAVRIEEAAAGGWRYEGVRFSVHSASLGESSATTASLHVVLDSTAYVVVGPSGPERRAAAAGQHLVLDLVHTAAGWRVSRVRR